MFDVPLETRINAGCLALPDKTVPFAQGEFSPHPAFAGVGLKLLAGAGQSAGALSCHLVRVESGHCLESHTHPENCEVHLVLAGGGEAELKGEAMDYLPGTVSLIPAGTRHRVAAGDKGLLIMALFAPAMA